jgi:hypothetical protein
MIIIAILLEVKTHSMLISIIQSYLTFLVVDARFDTRLGCSSLSSSLEPLLLEEDDEDEPDSERRRARVARLLDRVGALRCGARRVLFLAGALQASSKNWRTNIAYNIDLVK